MMITFWTLLLRCDDSTSIRGTWTFWSANSSTAGQKKNTNLKINVPLEKAQRGGSESLHCSQSSYILRLVESIRNVNKAQATDFQFRWSRTHHSDLYGTGTAGPVWSGPWCPAVSPLEDSTSPAASSVWSPTPLYQPWSSAIWHQTEL